MIIVFEGIHGCGKTTLLNKLRSWIKLNLKTPFITTKWNSYPNLKEFGNELKDKDLLDPLESSLLYGLDFNLRYKNIILPTLEKGGLVLCDRYIYTAYVRDGLRNISTTLLNEMYGHAKEPDIIFFLKIDPETAINRLEKTIEKRSNYILGLDLNLSSNKIENFKKFLYLQDKYYNKIIVENKKNFYVINSLDDENHQFDTVLKIFKNHFEDSQL
ncbi:dTMP kinase [Clostridium estertheticum]|uniref:dTMP kinase n=1 Tax=Clostridium estertheticum TaxID=238834 RepID=UPI00124DA596|nr:hypothetical protein [Clostridium estertheticum]MBZ9618264.1 hypothetical protein [Clostridium estertheticum subsp. laramiense]WAG76234.1 hypothetical protein LL032_23925 [Clostridium estertheticum]